MGADHPTRPNGGSCHAMATTRKTTGVVASCSTKRGAFPKRSSSGGMTDGIWVVLPFPFLSMMLIKEHRGSQRKGAVCAECCIMGRLSVSVALLIPLPKYKNVIEIARHNL